MSLASLCAPRANEPNKPIRLTPKFLISWLILGQEAENFAVSQHNAQDFFLLLNVKQTLYIILIPEFTRF